MDTLYYAEYYKMCWSRVPRAISHCLCLFLNVSFAFAIKNCRCSKNIKETLPDINGIYCYNQNSLLCPIDYPLHLYCPSSIIPVHSSCATAAQHAFRQDHSPPAPPHTHTPATSLFALHFAFNSDSNKGAYN